MHDRQKEVTELFVIISHLWGMHLNAPIKTDNWVEN